MERLGLKFLGGFLFSLVLCGVVSEASTEESAPFFQATSQHPYHLSIGAVLFDDQGRVACHHFDEIFGVQNIYILMRESMEDDETPLQTLARGLHEEFGATARPEAFLGCLSGNLIDFRFFSFEKTTLYVACKLIHWDPQNRDLNDPEGKSSIEWIAPETLIALMENQGQRFYHRVDLDESEIIRRAKPYLPNR